MNGPDWKLPAEAALAQIVQLHRAGLLDKAVSERPELKRLTDALATAGHIKTVDGKLVPVLDSSGWMKPSALEVRDPNVLPPMKPREGAPLSYWTPGKGPTYPRNGREKE